tara:strand:- start:126 stop:1337 length:1212 start_codon:yes stop_codon:yes gene_type:complete
MNKRTLSLTEPLRITAIENLGELPPRFGNATTTIDGTEHTLTGIYSTNNEWKRKFSKFKSQRRTHSPHRKKAISMADAHMLGTSAGRSGNILKQAQMKIACGILEDNRNQWKRAVKHYAKACQLYKQAQHLAGESLCCNFAAVSCYDAGDYEKAILFSAKQRSLASQMLQDNEYAAMAGEHFCYALNNEGLCHRKLNRPEEAANCHRRILGFSQRDDAAGDEAQARVLESLASGHLGIDMLMTANKLPKKVSMDNRSATTGIQSIASTSSHAENMLFTTLSSGTPSTSSQHVLQTLGMLSMKRGEYDLAAKHNEEACIQANQSNNKIQISTSNMHLGISKGQMKLQKFLNTLNTKMNTLPAVGGPLALKKMMEQARYSKKEEEEQEETAAGDMVFGSGEIVYH